MKQLRVGEIVTINELPHKNESGFISEILINPERDLFGEGCYNIMLFRCSHEYDNAAIDGDKLNGTGKLIELDEIKEIIDRTDNFTQNTLANMIINFGSTVRDENDTENLISVPNKSIR